VGDSEVGEQGVVLENHVHGTAVRRNADHRSAAYPHIAFAWLLETGDEAQRRRLAAARWAEQGMKGAAAHRKSDAVDRDELTVALRDLRKFDVRGGGRFLAHPVPASQILT